MIRPVPALVALMLAAPAAYAQMPAFAPGPGTSAALNESRSVVSVQSQSDRRKDAAGGAVVVPFGESMPSLVCAELYVCAIALEPGEIVSDVRIGDKARWEISMVVSGAGANKVTNISVKPNVVDIKTDLQIATDRRFYVVQLIASKNGEWTPVMSFTYPADVTATVAQYQQQVEKAYAASHLWTGENVAELNFDFVVTGKASWRPIRVYADQTKTYIEFPKNREAAEWPVLVPLAAGDEGPQISYRTRGNRMIVDKVLTKAALVLGAGDDQDRVVIEGSPRDRQ